VTYVGNDFSPQEPDEINTLSFDFVNELAVGENISSVVWSCEVVAGSDAAAATRLVGAGSVNGSKVSHRVGNLVAGMGYRIRAAATTSLGNVLALWSHVFCKSPA
jgi:hypothetical protein